MTKPHNSNKETQKMNTIIDSYELAEAQDLDPEDQVSKLTAVKEPEQSGMEFHVQMNGYTLRDMDEIIAQAAARMIVGRTGGETKIAKDIEAKIVAMTTAALDERLSKVSAEIVDQPMTPKFGDKNPVTMREMLGLFGREYLSEMVDRDGKPNTSGWGDTKEPRVQWIVKRTLEQKFKNEITAATNALVSTVQAEIRSAHEAFLKSEKARLAEALKKLSA